ncbi:MAG: sensor protein [Myxococcaceae bacterium]|nr:sensor protein [Myxococcaceae bacterium]
MTAPSEPADAALRESEARYRFLTETIPVQIWTALPDGRLDYVTRQTAESFGLTPERLLADGWQNVVHPDDLPLAIARWTHALATGEAYAVEFRVRLADGSYAYHLARAVAQRDEAGAIVRWFGTNTNIDEQREAQRRLQALLDEVARQAVESAAVITALHAAKERAEARVAELEARSRPTR